MIADSRLDPVTESPCMQGSSVLRRARPAEWKEQDEGWELLPESEKGDGGFRHSWTIVTCANGPSPILVRAITEPPGTPEVHEA